MQNFIETLNIARFAGLLRTEDDPEKRRILQELLAQEQAKHAETLKAARKP